MVFQRQPHSQRHTARGAIQPSRLMSSVAGTATHKFVRMTAGTLVGAVAIALSALATPGLADPFRTTDVRPFDSQVEAAFDAMFKEGNYVKAEELLQSASASEPMTHAMQASLAYFNADWDALGVEAQETLAAAEALAAIDPLRGNIYTAVGHFMEGAHTISTQGTVQATPIVLNKLRLVFDHLRQAEAIDPQDPELNLIKGYMDLMVAVNLPFSSPDQAIQRLQTYAGPRYLASRGLAIAYRDLEQYDLAMAAVDEAMSIAPENPDLYYLKAQILRLQDQLPESVRLFRRALADGDQLPLSVTRQIAYEMCRTQNENHNRSRNCHNWADQQIAGIADGDS